MTIFLTGILAKVVTVERAIALNKMGMVVTVDNGRVIVQKEKATSESAGD